MSNGTVVFTTAKSNLTRRGRVLATDKESGLVLVEWDEWPEWLKLIERPTEIDRHSASQHQGWVRVDGTRIRYEEA